MIAAKQSNTIRLPAIAPALDLLIVQLLEKEAAHRPPSAGYVSEQLARLAEAVKVANAEHDGHKANPMNLEKARALINAVLAE